MQKMVKNQAQGRSREAERGIGSWASFRSFEQSISRPYVQSFVSIVKTASSGKEGKGKATDQDVESRSLRSKRWYISSPSLEPGFRGDQNREN
jgi:hypothetical protein